MWQIEQVQKMRRWVHVGFLAVALVVPAALWGRFDTRPTNGRSSVEVIEAAAPMGADGGRGLEELAWEDAPAWNESGTSAAVFDGHETIEVLQLITRKRRAVLKLPPATRSPPWIRFAGNDLLVIDHVVPPAGGTDTRTEDGAEASQVLYLVSADDGHTIRSEPLGTAGKLLFYDAARDLLARLIFPSAVGERRPLSAKTAGTLERRGVRRPRLETFALPPWFDAGFIAMGGVFAGGEPRLLAERGGVCAFAVTKLHHAPGYGDEELRVAMVDALAERPVPRALGVTVGPSGGGAFSTKGDFASLHGPGADPVLVRANGSVRALGRTGSASDFMEPAGCVAFSEDGAMLAAVADGEPVRWYSVAAGQKLGACTARDVDDDEVPSPRKGATVPSTSSCTSVAHWRSCGVAFAKNSKLIFDFNGLGDLQEVDISTGRLGRGLYTSKQSEATKPRAVGNETWLTTGTIWPSNRFFQTTGPSPAQDSEMIATLHDLETFAPATLSKELGSATQVAVSPNGKFAITGAAVWDLERMTKLGAF